MSSIQMVRINNFHYQKLKPDIISDDEIGEREENLRPNNNKCWFRFRLRFKFRRAPVRRRLRLKVPILRRLWRKKGRVVSAFRISYAKVLRRFKDEQVHLGDLFAGNYLFMQINPASLKYLQKELSLSKIA